MSLYAELEEILQSELRNNRPANFEWDTCMVLFPVDRPAIVLFDLDIQIEVSRIEYFMHKFIAHYPVIGGVATAFAIFSKRIGFWGFDNSPKRSNFQGVSCMILTDWYRWDRQITVYRDLSKPEKRKQLQKVGLWVVPKLCPQVMLDIWDVVGDRQAVEQILVDACSEFFLQNLVSSWVNSNKPAFSTRESYFKGALDAFATGAYVSVTATLIPLIEGIYKDWLAESKMKPVKTYAAKYQQEAIHNDTTLDPLFKDILDVGTQYIKEGPLFESFDGTLDSDFANRHAICHGFNHPPHHTQVEAIKAFLIIDTLFCMSLESPRKMGHGWQSIKSITL